MDATGDTPAAPSTTPLAMTETHSLVSELIRDCSDLMLQVEDLRQMTETESSKDLFADLQGHLVLVKGSLSIVRRQCRPEG